MTVGSVDLILPVHCIDHTVTLWSAFNARKFIEVLPQFFTIYKCILHGGYLWLWPTELSKPEHLILYHSASLYTCIAVNCIEGTYGIALQSFLLQ